MSETPLSRVRAFQRAANPNGDYHWPAEEAANVGGVPLYFDDIEALADTDELDAVEVAIRRLREAEAAAETLRKQLAAATARAETAEAAYHRLDSEQAGAGSYAGRAEAAEAALAEQRETIAAQIADLGESRARNAHTTGPLAAVDRVQADTYRTAAWLIRNPDQFGKRDATPHTDLEQQAAEQGDGEGG